ncbi:MAG: DNA-processing protein DprA [Baileyella intestinalis]|uniref:DNA-processing protein DprA n=1 Tax=Baileyella intestinalis TaxID=2606709 RepID=UPI002A7533AB|nr:DNA-processing protein DprA [Baileyella intestinalis]MCI7686586.1 DNA-processing protein DprA [Clostridiales bacterium]MDY2994625.1 DNA-processing protein DprA [Baileyella intestinalis]
MKEIIRITMESDEYPDSLREIQGSPRELYCIGDISLLKTPCAAIVGSRRYTIYGRQTALMIGKMLAGRGITVVSGMAKGIDSFAHQGALSKQEGKTIAVLGTAIGKPYPASNAALMEEIEEKGLVISEYPPDFPGSQYGFPARNRIISGLSKSVIVVEAGLKSGSLITAQIAGDQGKTVFAVPGNINSQFSIGTNLLIRDGAYPLVVVDDVIREMGVQSLNRGTFGEDEEGFPVEMDDDEKKLYSEIRQEQGISPDALSEKVELPISKINGILTVMEIKGAIMMCSGRIFLNH